MSKNITTTTFTQHPVSYYIKYHNVIHIKIPFQHLNILNISKLYILLIAHKKYFTIIKNAFNCFVLIYYFFKKSG